MEIALFGDVYRTKIVAIQTSNSKIFTISKYQKPNAKVCLEISIIIIDEIETATIPSPLAYQQIKAKKGEITVIVIQIIIYDPGKKPAIKMVYR